MAINMTTPETIPAKVLDAAQITDVNLSLYKDGKNLQACSAFIGWRKGYVDGETFVEVTRDNYNLTAAEIAGLLIASQSAVPTESLLGAETPMDKIFTAIVQFLKSKGKM